MQYNLDLSSLSGGLSDDNSDFMIRFETDANKDNEIFFLDNIIVNGCGL